MTCIVAIADQGKVYMSGDSAGVAGLNITVRKDPKVARVGEFLIGFTSSFRMGQLLHQAFTPPAIPDGMDLYHYMVTLFVDALRDCFKAGGFARKHSDEESGGCFLVGVRGRLFEIESDYQVGESVAPYASVGCGSDFALGSLYSTPRYTPQQRLQIALYAAQENNGGVRGPFTYAELEQSA